MYQNPAIKIIYVLHQRSFAALYIPHKELKYIFTCNWKKKHIQLSIFIVNQKMLTSSISCKLGCFNAGRNHPKRHHKWPQGTNSTCLSYTTKAAPMLSLGMAVWPKESVPRPTWLSLVHTNLSPKQCSPCHVFSSTSSLAGPQIRSDFVHFSFIFEYFLHFKPLK